MKKLFYLNIIITLETSSNYLSSTNLDISLVNVTCFYTFPDIYFSSGSASNALYMSSTNLNHNVPKDLIVILLDRALLISSMYSLILLANSPKLEYIFF
jgi:hypothetical protein